MPISEAILSEVLSFTPENKAILVNELHNSLDQPDKSIDCLWADEADKRLDAYEKGTIKAISLNTVLKKYK